MPKLAVLESPYRGYDDKKTKENVLFAQMTARILYLSEGIVCIASHLLFPQYLDDMMRIERTDGIEAGWAFGDAAPLVIFALQPNLHPTHGMRLALSHWLEKGKEIRCERRSIRGIKLGVQTIREMFGDSQERNQK